MNLTLQYFTMYLSFFVSIIVSLLINTEIPCCVIPILEAAWMTVMVTVTGGHPSRLSPQCRLVSSGSGKERIASCSARILTTKAADGTIPVTAGLQTRMQDGMYLATWSALVS